MLTIFSNAHKRRFLRRRQSPRLPHHRRHRSSAAVAARPASRRSRAGARHSHKAIINVYLPGGPPHLDMWDLKPDAPREIRGEFKPIQHQRPRHRDLRALPAHRRA